MGNTHPLSIRTVLILLGTVTALLFSEILVRLTGTAPQLALIASDRYRPSPNPRIVYEPATGALADAAYSNALGYRGPLYSFKASPHHFRVIAAGDSVTEGLMVPDYKSIYTWQLEAMLTQRDVPSQIMNFGVSGYNTLQEVETLKDKGMSFNPDLILLQYSLNDTYLDDGRLAADILTRTERKSLHRRMLNIPLLYHSALYRFFIFRVIEDGLQDFTKRSHSLLVHQHQNTVASGFKTLQSIAGGRCVLIVVFPWFEKGLSPYPYEKQHEEVSALARSHGFHTLDLLDSFRSCSAAGRVNFDHVHPNAHGHTCAAQALADYLLQSDMIRQCRETARR